MATMNAVNNRSDDFKTTAQTIDPGVSGDGYIQYIIDGNEFIMGCDDSDGDVFVVSQGNALGTNNLFRMSSAGERTMPSNSACLCGRSTAYTNVTGAGTQYTCIYASEIYDQNSNFDGTSTFTAPVTGRYLFSYTLKTRPIAATATTGNLELTTSNRNYVSFVCDYGGLFYNDAYDQIIGSSSHYVDMDAADTAVLKIQISGMAGDTVGVMADVDGNYFSGTLMC